MRAYSRPVGKASDAWRYTNPAIFMKFNEGSGAVIGDALGNIADITVQGTTTTLLSATAGRMTPDSTAGNTTVSADLPATVDAYLKDMLNCGKYGQILIAFDLFFTTAASAANEGFLGIGDVTNGDVGWTIQLIQSSMRPSLVMRGVGGTTQSSVNPAGGTPTDGGARNSLVLDIQFTDAATSFEWFLNGPSIGSGAGDYGSSGTRPGANDFTDGVVLFAKAQGGSALPLGADSAGTSIDNLFIHSRVEASATAGARLAVEHFKRPGEPPRGIE